MENREQPNPEELLKAVKHEEDNRLKGKLKIFLGMAAGVGKTYSMLEEAQKLQKDGVSLLVGTIHTHGRDETARLIEGLNILPLKSIRYRDRGFEELDLDEVLKIHPELVLIDELAHSNVPGARHAKRWQDVIEILDNGIDVYTTMNVQHIESLKDVVEAITEITIRETVPDMIIEKADSIQLVDLSPDELLERLKEGKVYLGDKSALAAEHFFQKDRLTALREIVLRFTAEKVDHDLHIMVSAVERGEGLKARERLLVAVSHSPHSQKLIRTTRRIAFNLGAPWLAVHVDDGRVLSDEDVQILHRNLALARDLGAEVISTNDVDIVGGIERIARQRGVTQMIIGRPPKRPSFDIFRRFQILDRLARECTDIDIHVIRQDRVYATGRRFPRFDIQSSFGAYGIVAAVVLCLALANWYMLPFLGYKVAGFVFLLGILGLSLFARMGPVILASTLYAVIWDYYFIPPVGSFSIGTREDTLLLGLYFLTALVTGFLADRGRGNKELLARREESTRALYDIVKHIATAPTQKDILRSVEERLSAVFDGSFHILVKLLDNGLVWDSAPLLMINEKERNAALWVFENGAEAGWSTTTLPSVGHLYIPLKGFQEVVGVMAYHPRSKRLPTLEERNFLYTVGQQLANYLERCFAEERVRREEQREEIERMYQTVLRVVSLQLHTPLTTIQGALQGLREKPTKAQQGTIQKEIVKIEDASAGLWRTLDNVSAMAKLTGTIIPVRKADHHIERVITASLEGLTRYTEGRHIDVKVAAGIPVISFDFSLVKVMLQNLIRNAIEYSPKDSTVTVDAVVKESNVVLSVSDQGPGIPTDKLEAVFEDFYRVPDNVTPGMGLGLSVTKRIAEIHNGKVTVENRPEGGARFSIYLPIEGGGHKESIAV